MRRFAVLAFSTLALSCGSPSLPLAKAPAFEPRDQATSDAKRSEAEPLVVEWPSPARAKLEALAQRALVVVRYQGREMEVLGACSATGSYAYRPITRKHETLAITTEDELYAHLPLGAIKLAGALRSAGTLGVDMTVVGRWQADLVQPTASALRGECARATHVVTALTAGAFRFYAGARGDLGAKAGSAAAGAEGKSASTTRMLAEDGDEDSCARSSPGDTAPPFGCGAVLRLDLTPLSGPTEAMSACPSGTVWGGTSCVASTVSCPPGSSWNGTACVGAAPPPPPPAAPPSAPAGGAASGFYCYRIERKQGEPRLISSCFGDKAMCEAGLDHDRKVPNAKSATSCYPRPLAACFYLHNSMHCYETFGECSGVAEVWQPNDGCDNYDEYDMPTSRKPRGRRGPR
jgi:hypothetical protein